MRSELLEFICLHFYGDPAGTRTQNLQIRNLLLYPLELRDQSHKSEGQGILGPMNSQAHLLKINIISA